MTPEDPRLVDMAVRLGFLTPEQAAAPEPLSSLSEDQITAIRSVAGRVEELGTRPTKGLGESRESVPDIPQRLGPYEITRRIGQGAMGIVCAARDTRLDREVAIKILRGFRNREDMKRFRREQQVLARLMHPNIVAIFDIGEIDGLPFYVMQLVDGVSLADAMAEKSLPLRAAVEVLRQAAEAVDFANERGVLHRDLKPANILVTVDRRAMVSDFGLAKVLEGSERSVSATGIPIGTPAFMSPEQARGVVRELDRRVDVWGLGATLYFLLTGTPPFRGNSVAETMALVLSEEPEAPRQKVPGVPRDLETICLKALEKDVARRYASAGEFAEDLRRYLAGEPIEARELTQVVRWVSRNGRWIAAGVAAVVLAGSSVAGGTWWSRKREFERIRTETRQAFESGDWNRAFHTGRRGLELKHDAELRRMVDESRARLDEEAARREIEARIRPVEELIRETRPSFYAKGIAIRPRLEKVERSLSDLERASGDPRFAKFPEVWRTLGIGWFFVGEPDASEPALRKALELAPDDGRPDYYLARIAIERAFVEMLKAGDKERSRQWTQKAVIHMERAFSSRVAGPLDLEIARIYLLALEGKDGQEILRSCDQAIEKFGKEPGVEELRILRACLFRDQERVDALTRALDNCPHHAWGLFFRGDALRILGQQKAAIDNFTHALEVRPRFYWALKLRGFTRVEIGENAAGIEDLTLALKLDDSEAELFNCRGVARHRLRDLSGAETDFTEAIRRKPNMAIYYRNRGAVRAERGDKAGSQSDFAELQKLDPEKGVGAVEELTRDFMRSWYVAGAEIDKKGAKLEEALAELEKTAPPSAEAAFTLGNGWYHLGDFDRAEPQFRRALELAPSDTRSDYYLGRIALERAVGSLLRGGNAGDLLKRAKEHIERSATVMAPMNLDVARIFVAALEFRSGEEILRRCREGAARYANEQGVEEFLFLSAFLYRGADRLDVLTRVLERCPYHALALYFRSNVYHNLGQHKKAVEDLTAALRVRPRFHLALKQRGECRLDLGEPARAVDDLSLALRLDDSDGDVFHLRGLARHRLRDFERAEGDFDEALRRKSTSAVFFRNRGIVRRDRGNRAGASEDFESALRLDPKDGPSRVGRCALRIGVSEPRELLAELDRILADHPTLAEAWHLRGVVECQIPDFKAALASFDKAIKFDVTLALAWSDRGWVRYHLRDYAGATSDCTRAIELERLQPRAWHTRGLARKATGDFEGARDDFTETLKLDPKWIDAYSNRSMVLAKLQDYEGALADLDQAIRLSPSSGALWCNRGMVKVSLRRYEDALKDLDESIRLSPRLPEAYLNRGNVRYQLKDLPGAAKDYEAALEFGSPDWAHRPAIQKMLEQVRREMNP